VTSPRHLLQEVGKQGQSLSADQLVAVAQACRQPRHVRIHQRRVLQDKSSVRHTSSHIPPVMPRVSNAGQGRAYVGGAGI